MIGLTMLSNVNIPIQSFLGGYKTWRMHLLTHLVVKESCFILLWRHTKRTTSKKCKQRWNWHAHSYKSCETNNLKEKNNLSTSNYFFLRLVPILERHRRSLVLKALHHVFGEIIIFFKLSLTFLMEPSLILWELWKTRWKEGRQKWWKLYPGGGFSALSSEDFNCHGFLFVCLLEVFFLQAQLAKETSKFIVRNRWD